VRIQESYTRVHQGAAELTKFSRLSQVGSVAHQELVIISEAAPPSRALSCAGLRHPAERLGLSDLFSDSPGIVYHFRSYRLCIAVAHRVPLSTRPLRSGTTGRHLTAYTAARRLLANGSGNGKGIISLIRLPQRQ
jgi:hypothetical protein